MIPAIEQKPVKTIVIDGKDVQYLSVMTAHTTFRLSWSNRFRALFGKKITSYCYIYSLLEDPRVTGSATPGIVVERIITRKPKTKEKK